jgi:hypothetical protein
MSKIDSYSLRSFDPFNPGDNLAMNLMFYHPEVMKAKGYYKEGFDFAKVTDLHEIDNAKSVIDTKVTRASKNIMYSVVDQNDALVGWIWFYLDKQYPLPKKVRDEYGLTERNSRIYQVSYQKLMSSGWPLPLLEQLNHNTKLHLHRDRKGVIVTGLRMALKKLARDFAKLYQIPKKLVIYGYIKPDNAASEKVLSRNGFVKYPKQYKYEGELHDLWIHKI